MNVVGLPSISIVIPTWNGCSLLERFLPSVVGAGEVYTRETGAELEILVVDDGSADHTMEWLAGNSIPRVRAIRQEINRGFAAACNAGFQHAKCPLIFLLNNDVQVERDVLLHLAPHFRDPAVFAVTCKAFLPGTRQLVSGGKIGRFSGGFWRVHNNYDVSETSGRTWYSILAGGGFSAFDREKLLKLGGFDELLSPFYWEDVELSLRAWRRGWRILYEPKAIVYHQASRTIEPSFEREHVKISDQRNRLLTHWIHLEETTWMVEHIAAVVLLVIASFVTFNFAFCRALRLALKELPQVKARRQREQSEAQTRSRQIVEFFDSFARSLGSLRE
jgi:GT2 family glycosyltransferase